MFFRRICSPLELNNRKLLESYLKAIAVIIFTVPLGIVGFTFFILFKSAGYLKRELRY